LEHVSIAVTPNLVSGIDDCASKSRCASDLLPDEEERRTRICLFEDLEDGGGSSPMWAIVERQADSGRRNEPRLNAQQLRKRRNERRSGGRAPCDPSSRERRPRTFH
jgi:hypothetical protein